MRLGLEALIGMRRMRDCGNSEVPIRGRRTFRGAGRRDPQNEHGRLMVLVDTSVWMRFIANRMPYAAELDRLLERDEAVGHDLVYGELLIGDSASP